MCKALIKFVTMSKDELSNLKNMIIMEAAFNCLHIFRTVYPEIYKGREVIDSIIELTEVKAKPESFRVMYQKWKNEGQLTIGCDSPAQMLLVKLIGRRCVAMVTGIICKENSILDSSACNLVFEQMRLHRWFSQEWFYTSYRKSNDRRCYNSTEH